MNIFNNISQLFKRNKFYMNEQDNYTKNNQDFVNVQRL